VCTVTSAGIKRDPRAHQQITQFIVQKAKNTNKNGRRATV